MSGRFTLRAILLPIIVSAIALSAIPSTTASSTTASSTAVHLTEADLTERLRQRLEGDRTGACLLAAVVDGLHVVRGRYCARAAEPPPYTAAVEIGSLSKTMVAFLVADLIDRQGWSLDDPLARHLAAGTRVPRFGDDEIRIRHLLSHTAGLPALPPGMRVTDPANPYAELTATTLLAALADTRLERVPGTQAEYSNFAMMLLSLAVANAYGGDLEAALRARLFTPLAMHTASIRPTRASAWVQGHRSDGTLTPAWRIAPELAGVGMVRASLDDLVRYLQAQVAEPPGPLGERLQATHRPLAAGYAMNWVLSTVDGHDLILHEGATGGFSSLLVFEPGTRRGVVLLADTALGDLGGLGDTALSLLLGRAMPAPRRLQPAPASLLQAMPGDYRVATTGLTLRLWVDSGGLQIQAQGQPALPLSHDSRGDFFAPAAGFVLRPLPTGDKVDRLQLRQGGGLIEARRVDGALRPTARNPAWAELAGEYRLLPTFSIEIFEQDGQLQVQGSGQPAVTARQTAPDRITIDAVGAVITFERDASGRVDSATLQQSGQTLSGKKLTGAEPTGPDPGVTGRIP